MGTPKAHRELALNLIAVIWTTQGLAERDLTGGDPASARSRLDCIAPLAEELVQSTDANLLETAAVYWERRSAVLDSLNQSSHADESRARAIAVRHRIASVTKQT